MSKYLATFSGKFGDIMWSLATVKALSKLTGVKYDFACMPQYESLLPLIQTQSYIDQAFVDKEWQFMHSNYGDQPWNPQKHTACINSHPVGGYPCKQGWECCWHLGYRQHPGRIYGNKEMQLIDFCAYQQGITFTENPLPFLEMPDSAVMPPYVTYAFNDQYDEQKKLFFHALLADLGPTVTLVDVSKTPWQAAAALIKHSVGFFGCRSANFVIANALYKKILTYEPHPARNDEGHLGYVFGCKWGLEKCLPLALTPEQAAMVASPILREWIMEKTNEDAKAIAG